MVVVFVVGAHALVANHRLAGLHALHEPQSLELVEDAIDARAAHASLGLTQRVLDLHCGERARLGVEQLEHRTPRTAALVTGLGQRRLGLLDPVLAMHSRGRGGRIVRRRGHGHPHSRRMHPVHRLSICAADLEEPIMRC